MRIIKTEADKTTIRVHALHKQEGEQVVVEISHDESGKPIVVVMEMNYKNENDNVVYDSRETKADNN